MTNDASKFVGSIPKNYDKYLGPRIFEDFAQDIVNRLIKVSPASVLELAAGTGIVSQKIYDALSCQLTVTDLNESMLASARPKFSDDSKDIVFQQVDAMSTPFGDNSFDAVVCQFGVMFFPDKDKAYAETYRLLKPGGTYFFNVWETMDLNPFAKITHDVLSQYFPDDPPGFYKVPFCYQDIDVITTSLTMAGFSNIESETLSLVSQIPSIDDLSKGLICGNPVYDELLARKCDLEAIRKTVAQALNDQLGAEMPLQAIVFSAHK